MHVPISLSLPKKFFNIILIGGCLVSACGSENSKTKLTQSASTHPDVLASFFVELSEPLPIDTQLALAMVDPLNTHDLNPSFQIMQSVDELHFQLDFPAKKGMMLQYHYVRIGKSNETEIRSDGQPLPSRFYFISSHSRIQDTIIGFAAAPSTIQIGRIEGTVKIRGSNEPAIGVIVTTAGITTTSSMDGRFQLEGIPVGTQNITIFSPDGSLEPFEQQAIIEKDFITPVDIELNSRKLVNVTFIVKTPSSTPPHATLRLFGNTTSLGDSFAGLFGGISLSQNRAPTLSRQSQNEYLVVLQIPVDSEILYLYSLGDTFWNRETLLSDHSNFRRIFVAQEDMVIEDQIKSWDTQNYGPITFIFNPPASTTETDKIQIQFNAYGWMDPLEMWPTGDGKYEFSLFSPMNFSTPVNYRFCRSEICGTFEPEKKQDQIFTFQPGSTSQVIQSNGIQWAGWVPGTDATIVTTETSAPRSGDFHSIVELSDSYRPSWKSYYGTALDSALGLNANTLILPIPWTFQTANPVWLTLNLSQNPSIEDIRSIVSLAKERGFKVYLMASTQYPTTANDFWNQFSQDSAGWNQWLSAIFDFYSSSAMLAKETEADGLILGDENISSILGKTNSVPGVLDSYPEDGQQKWNGIFSKIRSIFSGNTLLAVNFDDLQSLDHSILTDIDGLYFLNIGSVSPTLGDVKIYSENISQKINDILEPYFVETGKIIWLGIDFPSVKSAHLGCVEFSSSCMVSSVLNFPAPVQPDLEVSLQEQANLYNAALPEENRRTWVNGIATRRYLVLGNYQDQSSSIRGKPSSDIIWYWFTSMAGKPTQ